MVPIFPSRLSYTPHRIHRKHKIFEDVCFRFVQTTVFALLSFLFFIIHQTFINAYVLFWYIMTLHCSLKCWTSSGTFFNFLLSPSFAGKSSMEWSISNLSLVKSAPTAGMLLGPVLPPWIPESFNAVLKY